MASRLPIVQPGPRRDVDRQPARDVVDELPTVAEAEGDDHCRRQDLEDDGLEPGEGPDTLEVLAEPRLDADVAPRPAMASRSAHGNRHGHDVGEDEDGLALDERRRQGDQQQRQQSQQLGARPALEPQRWNERVRFRSAQRSCRLTQSLHLRRRDPLSPGSRQGTDGPRLRSIAASLDWVRFCHLRGTDRPMGPCPRARADRASCTTRQWPGSNTGAISMPLGVSTAGRLDALPERSGQRVWLLRRQPEVRTRAHPADPADE